MRSKCVRAALLMTLAASTVFATAPITIVVVDPPGFGFNDKGLAAPVGGNTGATIGEQRLNALRYAPESGAASWIPPYRYAFAPGLGLCRATPPPAVAGEAGSIRVFRFESGTSEVIRNVWYPAALANKLVGSALDPDRKKSRPISILIWASPTVLPTTTGITVWILNSTGRHKHGVDRASRACPRAGVPSDHHVRRLQD